VLAGGGRVSPARAEDALLAQPWVSQAAVVSEGRPFPVVLVVPVFEQLQKAECARLGSERLQSEAQLVAPGCPARSEVDRQVAAALAVLAAHPQVAAHEVPRAAAILPERFQVSASRVSNMPARSARVQHLSRLRLAARAELRAGLIAGAAWYNNALRTAATPCHRATFQGHNRSSLRARESFTIMQWQWQL